MIGIIQYIKRTIPLFFAWFREDWVTPLIYDFIMNEESNKIISFASVNTASEAYLEIVEMNLFGVVSRRHAYDISDIAVLGVITIPGVVVAKGSGTSFYVLVKSRTSKLFRFNDVDDLDWAISITNIDYFNSFVRVPSVSNDDGVILSYRKLNTGTNRWEYGFCKYSPEGVKVWDTLTIISNLNTAYGARPENFNSVIINGYVYCGFTTRIINDVNYIFKIDVNDGTIVDQLRISFTGGTFSGAIGNVGHLATDGINIFFLKTGNFSQNLLKIDTDFNVLWQKKILQRSTILGYTNGYGAEGISIENGIIYFVGIENRAPYYNHSIMAIDTDGNLVNAPYSCYVTYDNTYSLSNLIKPIKVINNRLFSIQPASDVWILTSIPVNAEFQLDNLVGDYTNGPVPEDTYLLTINNEFFNSLAEITVEDIVTTIDDPALSFSSGIFTSDPFIPQSIDFPSDHRALPVVLNKV